jgi:replicative DNA helicase
MDYERLLVSKVVRSGQIESVTARGVESRHFGDAELRAIWTFLGDHVRQYKTPPSVTVVQSKFSNHNFEIVPDAIDFLIQGFVRQVKRRTAVQAVRTLASALDDTDESTIDDIDSRFSEVTRALSNAIPMGGVVARYSEMGRRVSSYAASKSTGLLPGIKTGIASIDNEILGIQPHEFVSVIGWQGIGKSTLVQFMLFNAYMAGHTPMLFSLEMESDALMRRWDTMALNFQYRALKWMELPDADMQRWENEADRAAKASNDIIVIDDVGRCTVDRVYAEAARFRPSIIGIDYISLLKAHRAGPIWEQVTELTNELKAMARSLRIPVVGVAQANIGSVREGAELHTIAYSRSVGQDSDIAIGMQVRTEEQIANKQMTIKLIKNRDGRLITADLFWDLDTMTIRDWRPQDQFQARLNGGVPFAAAKVTDGDD